MNGRGVANLTMHGRGTGDDGPLVTPRSRSPEILALELKEGDDIEIHVADEREFGVSRRPGREELVKRLRAFRGRLPADFRFDRDEANAR